MCKQDLAASISWLLPFVAVTKLTNWLECLEVVSSVSAIAAGLTAVKDAGTTITVGADGAVKVAVEAPRLPADEEFNSWLQLRVLNANFEWQKVLGKVRARNATLLKKKKKKAKAAKEVEEAAVVAAASASAEPEPEPES